MLNDSKTHGNVTLGKLPEKRVFEVFPDRYTGTALMNRGMPHKRTQQTGRIHVA